MELRSDVFSALRSAALDCSQFDQEGECVCGTQSICADKGCCFRVLPAIKAGADCVQCVHDAEVCNVVSLFHCKVNLCLHVVTSKLHPQSEH